MRDNVLSDTDLTRACPLDNNRHILKPRLDLGRLSILPLELLTDAFLRLDILSLTAFRRVNIRAMQAVDSIPQYSTIYEQSPRVLRAVISVEATCFSLITLYQSVCETRCTICGDFGGYLYLITCSRVCFICFTENKLFLPVNPKFASMATGRSREELKKLPHIRSVHGLYADRLRAYHQRLTLWDRETLRSVQLRPTADEKLDFFSEDPRRFMAIVSAPYFVPPSTIANWGLYCTGCSISTERETCFRKQYSERDFVDHIVRYGPVVLGETEDRPRHLPTTTPG